MFDLSVMDLAPGPDTTETLKSPVVELNVVETGDANVDDDSTPSRPAIHRSKSPTSDADDVSDESGEGEEWRQTRCMKRHYILFEMINSRLVSIPL